MSSIGRAVIFALLQGMATAVPIEWKGSFYTPEASYTWQAQKVNGAYADAEMVLVAIPTSTEGELGMNDAISKGTAAMDLAVISGGAITGCEEATTGSVIKPAEGKCYKLVFDQANDKTTFLVNTADTAYTVFFAQHFPTEFEDTEHYFKDQSGVDIEPVAQDPEPSGDSHGHSHGHGDGGFEGYCVCQAANNNWVLDCSSMQKVEAATLYLEANTECKGQNPPQACINNFYIMQAHHDHCLHDVLPTGIEQKLHDYEHYYTDCFVKRQFDPDLSACPPVDCNNAKLMTDAIATLQSGCATSTECAESACAAAVKVVLTVHDLCSEDQLPNNLEVALHDHEEPCAEQLCNTADAAFDPYADSCSDTTAPTPAPTTAPAESETDGARGFESQGAVLVSVATLALSLAVMNSA